MQKLTTLLCNLAPNTNIRIPEFRGLQYRFQLPTSRRTIRKMAESVNHQEVHDLLVEIARKAGDMIATAQPHVNTSSSKMNCWLLVGLGRDGGKG